MSEEIDDKTYSEAAMISFARGVVVFHRELIKAGISPSDALLLTVEFMRIIARPMQ